MSAEGRIQLLRNGAQAARTSAVVTTMLALVKAGVGFLSGSIALLGDAVHSFADVSASVAVWLGLKLSQRRPSERFPYGFYKVETFTLLLVSLFVAVAGGEILLESLRRVMSPSPVAFVSVTLSVAALSSVVSLLLFRYKLQIGRMTNSQALLGEAKHSLTDVWSSALVFIGILAQYVGLAPAESIAGLLIGVLIIWLGVGMGRDAVLVLLDACLKPELISQMRNITNEVDGVKGVHDIKVRRSGPFIFGEMHVELDSAMSVEKAARISDTIEDNIRRSIQQLDSLLVRTEPSKKDVYRIAIPVVHDGGLSSKVSEHFGKSPYFIFIDLHEGNPVSWFVVENPAVSLDKKRGIEAAHLLARHKADALVTREVGEGPYHVLRDSSVHVLALNRKSEIRQVLDAFSRRALRGLVPVNKQA